MLGSITRTYKNMKDYVGREKSFRELARAIENRPIETINFSYKALTMLIPTAATVVSCAATNEVKKPKAAVEKSQWTKSTPPIDYYFGPVSRGGDSNYHTGIDFHVPIGTPIAAAANGVVASSDYPSGKEGNCIIIHHGNRETTGYGHLSEMVAKKGDIVFRGMLIGYSGATGYVYGPHLHFGKGVKGVSVDPMKSWAEGKALTYDGRKDYDNEFREGKSELKLSAPFIGPIPKGNVDLEKIVRTADVSEEGLKKFLAESEQYKQELFNASIALIAKKYPPIAKELSGLPILNDGISKEEALSVWRLYDAIKDIESQLGSVKKAVNEIAIAGKDQRWNFYLQELIRYGAEKNLSSVLKSYTDLPRLIKHIWGKLPR